MTVYLGNIEIPEPVEIEQSYEEVYQENGENESITGKLHLVFVPADSSPNFGTYTTIKFRRKFTISLFDIDETTAGQLLAIDGTNQELFVDRDEYKEKYNGNISMIYSKWENHNWFDTFEIEFTVTEELYSEISANLMWFGHYLTNPVENNNSIMFFGDEV